MFERKVNKIGNRKKKNPLMREKSGTFTGVSGNIACIFSGQLKTIIRGSIWS